MKIIVGCIMKCFKENVIALEIPGVGVVETTKGKDGISPFPFVELTRKQLLKLNVEIAKELMNGKENHME
jgi:hypothetical protein